ncbi:MAG: hypothetical protein HYT39_00875 [Candidatus Sungbacteria bacterium]|nr:hypothetical protein [Candidatus Sungbacteria bacterium]
MKSLVLVLENAGFSEMEAKTYLATLELGEGSVNQIAAKARLKRTSVYYAVDELVRRGALIETKYGKKTYFVVEKPERLLETAQRKTAELERALPALKAAGENRNPDPQIYYFYGPIGFKQLWEKVLSPETKEYRIITAAEHFDEYVREKYILRHIISLKKKRGIFSYQIISDSPLARSIVAKDPNENRRSKILSSRYKLPYSEIITENGVALISPRRENILMMIESPSLAKTRRAVFEALWSSL